MNRWGNAQARGFGLIELLIALALGLVLVLGVVQVFVGSKQTFVLQRTAAGFNEDARYLASRLSRELRMVGMFGCLDLNRLPAGIRNALPAELAAPVGYTTTAGVSILSLISAVPNHERFTVPVTRRPANYRARWLIATNCRDTHDLRISDGAPIAVRPGDVVIPLRQLEYRFRRHGIQLRSNGAGHFQSLIDNVAQLEVSFGLAATATGREVSGSYVSALAAGDGPRIRSVKLRWQLSDTPSAPSAGKVRVHEFQQAVALRNRIN